MRNQGIALTVFLAMNFACPAQLVQLGSFKAAKSVMYNVRLSPEEVLGYSRFEGFEKDTLVNIVRFDNMGLTMLGEGPWVVSSKLPIITDSLGQIGLNLAEDHMVIFVTLVEEMNTGWQSPRGDVHSFRVTFRNNGRSRIYYVKNTEDCLTYFKRIERAIVEFKSIEAKATFYRFVEQAGLVVRTDRGFSWLN